MGNIFHLLDLCVKKQQKGRKILFVLLQAAYAKLNEDYSEVSIEVSSVETGRLVAILDEQVRDLNREEGVFLRSDVEGWFNKCGEMVGLLTPRDLFLSFTTRGTKISCLTVISPI